MLQSMGSQRVGHDLVTEQHTNISKTVRGYCWNRGSISTKSSKESSLSSVFLGPSPGLSIRICRGGMEESVYLLLSQVILIHSPGLGSTGFYNSCYEKRLAYL